MRDQIRELFIDELEQIHGGGPIEDLWNAIGVQPSDPELSALKDLPIYTTMACGEEGPSGCSLGNCC